MTVSDEQMAYVDHILNTDWSEESAKMMDSGKSLLEGEKFQFYPFWEEAMRHFYPYANKRQLKVMWVLSGGAFDVPGEKAVDQAKELYAKVELTNWWMNAFASLMVLNGFAFIILALLGQAACFVFAAIVAIGLLITVKKPKASSEGNT